MYQRGVYSLCPSSAFGDITSVYADDLNNVCWDEDLVMVSTPAPGNIGFGTTFLA